MRETSANIHLIVLDPGHFHAALLQKQMHVDISPTVYVYAPEGPDLEAYLNLIAGFNQRPCNPTKWETHVYRGPDYLTRMTRDKVGNLVIIAGKHSHRMNYILASVEAGLNVLADKPMTITRRFRMVTQSLRTRRGKEDTPLRHHD
jgi:predicted dehydrogenase